MKKRTDRGGAYVLIYIRYLLPIALCLAMLMSTLVPCLQYSTTEGTNDKISASELYENSWDQVRHYLFSGAETKADQARFSRVMLATLIIMAVLFALGALGTAAIAFFALRYVNDPDKKRAKNDVWRIWFVTVIPNRIVCCVIFALTLPLTFLSRLIVPMYDTMMNVDVLLRVSFPEPWVWALISLAVVIAMSVASSVYEKKLKVDVFESEKQKKRNALGKFAEDTEDTEELSEMRARQAELVKNILAKKDDTDGKD